MSIVENLKLDLFPLFSPTRTQLSISPMNTSCGFSIFALALGKKSFLRDTDKKPSLHPLPDAHRNEIITNRGSELRPCSELLREISQNPSGSGCFGVWGRWSHCARPPGPLDPMPP